MEILEREFADCPVILPLLSHKYSYARFFFKKGGLGFRSVVWAIFLAARHFSGLHLACHLDGLVLE